MHLLCDEKGDNVALMVCETWHLRQANYASVANYAKAWAAVGSRTLVKMHVG